MPDLRNYGFMKVKVLVIQKHEKNKCKYFTWHHTVAEKEREVPCPLFVHYGPYVPALDRRGWGVELNKCIHNFLAVHYLMRGKSRLSGNKRAPFLNKIHEVWRKDHGLWHHTDLSDEIFIPPLSSWTTLNKTLNRFELCFLDFLKWEY